MVNEFRVGYNYDYSRPAEQLRRTGRDQRSSGWRRRPASLARAEFGFPSFTFTGSEPAHQHHRRRLGTSTARFTERSFSISDNLTWIIGSHSLKAGGLWNRNMAPDGFGLRRELPGPLRVQRHGDRVTRSRTSCLAPRRARDQSRPRGSARRPLRRLRGVRPGRLEGKQNLTVFLGLRYEVTGVWHEKSDMIANFILADGGHHVVPNAEVADHLPPGLQDLGRTQSPARTAIRDTLVNTDKNNFSPRVGFAWRLGGNNKTVLRGGFGLFHPTVAVQGIRDPGHERVPLLRGLPQTRPAARLLAGTPFVDPAAFGNQGIDPNLQSPDIYQYNLTLERQVGSDLGLRVSYIGSTMRKLLIDTRLQHAARQHRVLRPDDPAYYARLPYYPYGTYCERRREQRRRAAPRAPGRAEPPVEERPGAERGLHVRPLRQQGP